MKSETVLITGSSRGLGKELALVFAKGNYDILIHGRNIDDLRAVNEAIIKIGVHCDICRGDLSQDKTIESLYAEARSKDVSVLINNAGTDICFEDGGMELKTTLNRITDEQVDEIITTNLIAPIKLSRRIYSLFLEKGNGTIINISSISGLEAHRLRTVYSASKWGLRGFTDSLRLEAKEHGIRVIGVYPSRILTKPFFTSGMSPSEVANRIYEEYKNSCIAEIIIDERIKK